MYAAAGVTMGIGMWPLKTSSRLPVPTAAAAPASVRGVGAGRTTPHSQLRQLIFGLPDDLSLTRRPLINGHSCQQVH